MKSSSVTIQMKATEHYFPVVLFITLQVIGLIKFLSVTIQMKLIYWPPISILLLSLQNSNVKRQQKFVQS